MPHYIGFRLRLIAHLIDTFLLSIIFAFIKTILIILPLPLLLIAFLNILFDFLIILIYESYYTSRYGGTIGKLLMKIKVTNQKGGLLTFKQAALRFLTKILSSMILFIGHLFIILDKKKQALHDKIMETYVIEDSKSTVNPKLKKTTIILVIIGLLIYLYIQITGAILSLIIPSKVLYENVDPRDFCQSQPFYHKDLCYSTFLSMPITMDKKLAICDRISDGQINSACYAQIGAYKNDRSYCNRAKYKTYCIGKFNTYTKVNKKLLDGQLLYELLEGQ